MTTPNVPPPFNPPSATPMPLPSSKVEYATDGKIEINESVLERAKQNDQKALHLMFEQFIPQNETIHFAEYMGDLGIILFVTDSFVCVTNKRIISLKVGSFGEIVYQDGMLEDINSGVIYQPSIFGLYVYGILLVIFTFGIGILLLPFLVKLYYKINKCGLVCIIKEGLSVYVFVNRNKLVRANALWRMWSEMREPRLKEIKKG